MSKIVVGSCVLVEKDGKLLLGARGKKGSSYGKLVIPGGTVELYESIEDTAVREIREETGVEIKDLCQFRVYQSIKPEKESHRVVIFWNARYAGGRLAAGDDLMTAQFYSKDEIKNEAKNGNIAEIMLAVLRDAGWLVY